MPKNQKALEAIKDQIQGDTLCHMTDAEKKAYNAEYYRNHKNYWQDYYSKGQTVGRPMARPKYVTEGNGKGVQRRGSGLGMGPFKKTGSVATRYQMDSHGNIKPQTQQEINDEWGEDWHDAFYSQKKGNARTSYQRYAQGYQQMMADAKANYDQLKNDPNSEVNAADFNKKFRKEYNDLMYKEATQKDAGLDTALNLGYEYEKKLVKKQLKQVLNSDRNLSTKAKLSMKLGKARVEMMLGKMDWKITKAITEFKMRGSNPFK